MAKTKTMEMFIDEQDLGTAVQVIRGIVVPKHFRTIRVGWCGWKDWEQAWYIRINVTEEERINISQWYVYNLPGINK